MGNVEEDSPKFSGPSVSLICTGRRDRKTALDLIFAIRAFNSVGVPVFKNYGVVLGHAVACFHIAL